MTQLFEDFLRQLMDAAGTQNCGCDPCCPEQTGSGEGPWMVTVAWHHAGSAILRSSRESVGYSASDAGYNGVAILTSGTELAVLETDINLEWYRVRAPDGVEGWIFASRTEYLSGTCLGHPFVDKWDGRDGSPLNAIAYAKGVMASELKGTDYANRCLSFVNKCYNITQVPTRCPLMYNPWRCNHPGNAIGAFRALLTCGKIVFSLDSIPPGAIMFWGASERNGNHGHVAIMDDDGVKVITSGFIRDVGTDHEVPTPVTIMDDVYRVATWTGAITLGYTTADIGFTPGTWGAGSGSTTAG
jgi:hypothetical protein